MELKDEDYVVCQICKKPFIKITNTHIETHGISKAEYQLKYPNAKRQSKKYTENHHKNIRNKTYEEIYGEKRAVDIKKKRSDKLTQYKLEERTCKICKKIFIEKENSKKVCCSKKCGFENMRVEKVEEVCLSCGSVFYKYETNNQKFCSAQCNSKYISEFNIVSACKMCGKEIKIKHLYNNHEHFCGTTCKKQYSVINRKKDYRNKAYIAYGKICSRCNSVKNLLVHHKDSNRLNNNIENLEVLCRKCHSKLTREINKTTTQFIGQKNIETGMIEILIGLKKAFGLDITNENFRLTPKRVARAYYEIFSGINAYNELKEIAETSFPSDYDGMIIIEDIRVFSMCPHHFLPVEYIVNVGYIPGKKTVGISKLSRIVEILAKQPVIQETFTKTISNILEKELKPKGTIVQVKGRHFCMVMRGIKKDSWTMTSSITGRFKEDSSTKSEFLSLLGMRT